jgi:cytochrome c oxidase assembly factor CtaG
MVDVVAVLAIIVIGGGYAAGYRRAAAAAEVRRGHAVAMASALVVWAVATAGPLASYAALLFWVRALQVLLLLMVVPFLVASARPLAVARAATGPRGVARIDAALAGRVARTLCSPAVTSAVMLATPWLLYKTPWYVAALVNPVVGTATRMLLVAIGFGYFYTRLQADPVPRRYSPLLSVGISVVESLADGLLGLVLWLGPLIAVDYYEGLHRSFGPSMRTDQSIGAGVLWILGDVLGIPFLMVLMRALGRHERTHAAVVDAEQDAVEEDDEAPALWWEADPQLRDRYGR